MTNPTMSVADTFKSEWTKLWTLSVTRRSMLAAPAVACTVAALFCLTMERTTGVPLADRSLLDVVTTSLLGADAAAVLLMAVSAVTIGSEYSSGMISTTLTATPRRWRMLLAKAAVSGLVTLGVGLMSALLAFAVGQLVLVAAGMPTANLADPTLWRLVCRSALMAPLYSLTSVVFRIVIRSTAGGIIGSLVLLFLPALVGWLPQWWRVYVLPYLPGEALHSLSGLTTPDRVAYSAPAVAVLTLTVWVAAMLATARARLTEHGT